MFTWFPLIITYKYKPLLLFFQILVEVPYILSQTGVYSVIVYAMIGFDWTAAKFFWYLFYQFSCLLYMTYYGMMTVAITPNANIAAIIAASFYAIFNLFSGFIVPRPVSTSKHFANSTWPIFTCAKITLFITGYSTWLIRWLI